MVGFIFDLDQTLVNSSIAKKARNSRNWKEVYSLISDFELYDGLSELFAFIDSSDTRVGIVTNSPQKYALKVLRQFNIKYDALVAYHDTRNHKPHPEPILFAIDRLNIDKDSLYSLGDSKNDILASNSAGLNSCACYWGTEDAIGLDSSHPRHKFYTPFEALDFARKLVK